MSRVALDIGGAAKASSTTKQEIVHAISSRELKARRIGDRAVILRRDLAEWIDRKPNWYPSS